MILVIIWGAVGLGLVIGVGFYKEVFVSFLFILISVEFFLWLIRKVGFNCLKEKDICVRMFFFDKDKMIEILKEMKSKQFCIYLVWIDDLCEIENLIMEVKISVYKNCYIIDVYYDIKEIQGVVGVKCDML